MNVFSKGLLTTIIIITVSACANRPIEHQTVTIGEVSQAQLMAKHKYFQQSFRAFQLTEMEISEIKSWPNDLHVEVYFGSWCHDSQREVPKFLKIIAQSSSLSYRLIGLDYDKSEPSGMAKDHQIKYTPTFVIYQHDQEIGRIIERPMVTLIADISAML